MLNVIRGRLAETPEIKQIKKVGEDGKEQSLNVINTNLYIKANKESPDFPVKITAWEDTARELSKYKKGELVDFVGNMKSTTYKPEWSEKEITSIGFNVVKIDHDKKLSKEIDEILSKFQKREKENDIDKRQQKDMDMQIEK